MPKIGGGLHRIYNIVGVWVNSLFLASTKYNGARFLSWHPEKKRIPAPKYCFLHQPSVHRSILLAQLHRTGAQTGKKRAQPQWSDATCLE